MAPDRLKDAIPPVHLTLNRQSSSLNSLIHTNAANTIIKQGILGKSKASKKVSRDNQ